MAGRVLCIGAQGVLGSLGARELASAGWSVVRAGRRPENGDGFRVVDVTRSETVVEAMQDVDLAVNFVPHPGALQAALSAGRAVLNVAMLDVSDLRRLRADSAEAPGLAVPNAGLAPGVATLVAADLRATHPEADALELALSFSARGSSGRAGAEDVHGALSARSHHPTRRINLPAPFGPRRYFALGDQGAMWLGMEGDFDMPFYASFSERLARIPLLAANALRLMRALPRASFTAGRGRLPTEPSREPVCEWVAVSRGGELLAAKTIQGEGDYRSTLAAAVVFADALLARLSSENELRGVRGVEELFSLEQLEPALREAGIRVEDAPLQGT